jgi:hypothetical protein
MGQVLRIKAQEQDVVWGKVKAKVKAEWVDRSPQDRAEIASVRSAATAHLIPQGSPAIRKRAPSAARD